MSVFNAFKALETVLKVVTVTEGVARLTDTGEPDTEASGEEMAMDNENTSGTLIEEFELEAKYLVKRVRDLLKEGNARKVIIKDSKGKYLLEIPMTVGVLAGSMFVLYAPVMTALSAVAAAVTNVKITVVRAEEDADSDTDAD